MASPLLGSTQRNDSPLDQGDLELAGFLIPGLEACPSLKSDGCLLDS